MRGRVPTLWVAVLCLSSLSLFAQSRGSKSPGTLQQNSGITWAMQAMQALTGGNPVSSVSESGTVVRTLGGDQTQGSITLQSSGVMNGEMDITTSAGVRSEVRTFSSGDPDGAWIDLQGQRHPMVLHNCWTDAVWFFPALSLLADYADPELVFEDLGQQQFQGGYVEHIRVHRTRQGLSDEQARVLARVSTVHFYLDSQTTIPKVLGFDAYGDDNFGTSIPVQIVYSDYRPVNGVQTPFQVTKLLNGSPNLQITISSANLNNPVQR